MTNVEGMTKHEARRGADEDAFWGLAQTLVVREDVPAQRVYDLEKRTAHFGEAVIDFAKTIPQTAVTSRLISQLVGAATSVGANYVEADDAISKREFLKNIGTCRKEAREVKHFLRMAVRALPELKGQASRYGLKPENCTLSFRKSGEANNDVEYSSFGLPSSFGIRHWSFPNSSF